LPFIVLLIILVPIGTLMLPHVSVTAFKAGVGILLILYSGFFLLKRVALHVHGGGRTADGVVGFCAGILGGVAGLSGPLPTIWAGLRGWDKDVKLGVFRAFNLAVLTIALVSQALAGFMTAELGRLVLVALPGTLIGAYLGRRLYGRLDNARFERIVLVLLLIAGLTLLASALR
jgi:uncharacterized membrane protein YfcA